MIVTTESGTVYCIEPDYATRIGSTPLRKDGVRLPLLELAQCEVGLPLIMVLDLRGDGVSTVRRSTIVTDIEERP